METRVAPHEDFTGIGPSHYAYPARYRRRYVVLPDRRRVYGRAPGMSGVSCAEHLLRDELAREIGGITEVNLGYGRADVLTKDAVFEVESVKNWRHGVRQALAYSAQSDLPPSLALYGEMPKWDVTDIFLRLKWGKPKVELWWYAGSRWEHITDIPECTDMPSPVAALERLKAAARRPWG